MYRTTLRVGLCALVSALWFAPRDAAAVQFVSNCSTTCTQNCELSGNISCVDGNPGINLQGAINLDLKGHTITCTSAGGCGGELIAMGSNNSVVKDTGATKGKIAGEFFTAVNCFGKSGSTVTGIVIDGVDGSAILNCATVENNIIVAGAEEEYNFTYAIETYGIANTDVIRNNYISGFGRSIKVTSDKTVAVERNLIIEAPSGYPKVGINAQFARSLNATANTVLSSDLQTPIAPPRKLCDGGPNQFAECTVNSECPSGTCTKKLCTGGDNNDFQCNVNSQCPGGTCVDPAQTFMFNHCDAGGTDCAACIADGRCIALENPVCP